MLFCNLKKKFLFFVLFAVRAIIFCMRFLDPLYRGRSIPPSVRLFEVDVHKFFEKCSLKAVERSVEFRRLIPPCSQMVKNKGELIFGRKSSKIFRLRRAFLDVWSPFSSVSDPFESHFFRPSADLRCPTTRGN